MHPDHLAESPSPQPHAVNCAQASVAAAFGAGAQATITIASGLVSNAADTPAKAHTHTFLCLTPPARLPTHSVTCPPTHPFCPCRLLQLLPLAPLPMPPTPLKPLTQPQHRQQQASSQMLQPLPLRHTAYIFMFLLLPTHPPTHPPIHLPVFYMQAAAAAATGAVSDASDAAQATNTTAAQTATGLVSDAAATAAKTHRIHLHVSLVAHSPTHPPAHPPSRFLYAGRRCSCYWCCFRCLRRRPSHHHNRSTDSNRHCLRCCRHNGGTY